MVNLLKYCRPRFSLRTLFIAMTVCCWLSYQLVWIWRRHDALAHLHIGSYATPTGFTLNNVPFDPYSLPSQEARNVRAPWSIRLLGESGVATISVYGPDHAAIAANFRRLFPEATVDSAETQPPTSLERHVQMRKQMEAMIRSAGGAIPGQGRIPPASAVGDDAAASGKVGRGSL